MIDGISDATLVALIGALGGLLLGLAARLGRFCTLGAIEDYFYGGSDIRLRMWGVAIGVSMTLIYAAAAYGMFDPTAGFYLKTKWLPWASVIGGGMFGYGMAMAGNCGYGALARLGGGDLRSFLIVVVVGISAYGTLYGPAAFVFDAVFPRLPASAPQGIAHGLSRVLPVAPWAVGVTAGLAILAFSVWPQRMRKNRKSVIWGAVVGLAIASGWIGTGWVEHNGFEVVPVVSHNFSAPVGEAMLYAMLGSTHAPSFAVGSVLGVWTGALIGSFMLGHFRWEACEDPRELRRQIIGAILMGVGAVIALGCTVGQGLTAMSLLSYSAPVTMAAILGGAALGLRHLIEGFAPAE
ncbi:YeeE/YedE family protein [Donghicola sp. C2-DW-16]|uniref:YeeE/YedE family protein n=1 Tax=Donghicola mangrovi TaxID=2729614 RepID=A0ABX2PF36_9RHOB|nr:YeeE/YedE family protein [Donghicola mangrovi]NVO27674.1 YeeE/YedE family protein [Donghicola mangrovi]